MLNQTLALHVWQLVAAFTVAWLAVAANQTRL
jgi:hypothetical protein